MNATTPLDVTALAGSFALVTTLVMQLVKPFIERLPGLMAPANQDLHDATLRLVQYAINLSLLVAAALTVSSAFAGLSWFDLLAVSMGQSAVSHLTYQMATAGKVDAPPLLPGLPPAPGQ